ARSRHAAWQASSRRPYNRDTRPASGGQTAASLVRRPRPVEIVGVLFHGNDVGFVEPTAEIDIGATDGAERPIARSDRRAADRAGGRGGRFRIRSHGFLTRSYTNARRPEPINARP